MYEFGLTLKKPFEQALEQVRQVLMDNQLGIVSDVDVQATLKNKIGKEIPSYRILGACNPVLADRVLEAEPNAGTLLPCNLILRAVSDNETVVSFMDPVAVLGLSDSAEVRAVAVEARAKLDQVVAQLKN
ncbi:MAG: DUF302 domain-containing protein [Sedimenticola sp.]|uniref:DUF302 domain-containing protein n=1 Tax=Sedimenticola thiotaurini TaxID=1543721 RepID=A0A558CX03_9GAMM|nr:DUF302 domain-containing protein [Sedimenticola sp.]TVT53276.1 MAG: DUF302 domain-containing protein [Sedimenticola thiotaurini]